MSDKITYPWPEPPAPGTATQVAPGVQWMRLPLPMALDHVNVYAFDDTVHGGEGWTIIDTGFDSRKTRTLWEAPPQPTHPRPRQRCVWSHRS